MFVSKGKINTSNFFPLLHPEKSQEKPQYNMAISPFLGKAPHFALPLPFSRNIFQTSPPFPSILKMSNPPPPILYEGGGGSNYVCCLLSAKQNIITFSLVSWTIQPCKKKERKEKNAHHLSLCKKGVSPHLYDLFIYSWCSNLSVHFLFQKIFSLFFSFFFKWDKYNTTLNMARIVWKKIFTINHMFWRFLPQLIWNLKDLDSGTTDISGNVFFFNCDLLYLTEQHSLLWFCIIEIFFLIKYVVCHSNQQTLFFVNS